MGTTKLVIREDKANAKGESPILVLYTHNSKSVKISTGRKVQIHYWDKGSKNAGGRVKKSFRGFTELNSAIEAQEAEIQKIANIAISLGIEPTVEYVKSKVVSNKGNKNVKQPLELLPFISKYIEDASINRKSSTLSVYRTTLKHLRNFEQAKLKRGKVLLFETIDLDFYQDFTSYLTNDLGLSNNSVGKYIKTIKTFLSEATERGLNQKLSFKSKRFKVIQEDTDAVYLNEIEVGILCQLDLSKNKRLEKVRDLFTVGCWVGLRFSDLKEVRAENFVKEGNIKLLRIRAIKTGEEVFIPLHPIVEEVLDKYQGNLPRTISNQKMNDYLKELCQLAGFDNLETVTIYKGATRIDKQVKKYELISTHTARRSFATNLFLQGLPTYTIMKITGHRTEKAFLRYIKVSAKEHAKILSLHWQKMQPTRNY